MQTDAADLDPRTRLFYCHAMAALAEARVPYLVGGAYAMFRFTGIERHTKDLDIFLRPEHRDIALQALAAAGCTTEVAYPHWLAKARCGEDFIDLIYSSGNGVAVVDDGWFAHAVADTVLDMPVQLCPVEEMIWSKAFVQERERYDGADVAHLLLVQGRRVDWERLLCRFGPHWRVLLAHLLLFGFIYPSQRATVPAHILRRLWRLAEREHAAAAAETPVCHGTLLSRAQYLHDIEHGGYADGRLDGAVSMTGDDIRRWTAAITGEHDNHDRDQLIAAAGGDC